MGNPAPYLVLVNLLLLGLSAYWGALSATTAVASILRPLPRVQLAAPPPPAAPQPHQPEHYYAAIYQRDIFNAKKPEAPKAAPPPVRTQLQLRLWGVAIHHGSKPSYAIIEDLRQRKQELYRVGDTVPGDAKVVRIEWDKVTLERDGQKEFLELSNEDQQTAQRGGRARQPVASAPPARLGGGIEQLADDEFAIDRAEVDTALENINQLFTQIRAVPHFEGGESTGFRVFAIRSGSIFDRIGIRNGDIIRNINEVPITDPARAMALFQELRNERSISVDVTRNKQPISLSYQIR